MLLIDEEDNSGYDKDTSGPQHFGRARLSKFLWERHNHI